MSQTNDLYVHAELSLAAYANLTVGVPSQAELRKAGMSQSEAEHFAATWAVVDQFTDSSSGFSATVFERDGQRYLAIRGTEINDVRDLLSDADLAVSGAAAKQIVALYNYVQRLTGNKGQAVPQLAWNGQNYVLNSATGAVGLLDKPISGALTVTGHSLGGHLAAAFGRLFPQLTAQIDTYNAPGFLDGVAAGFFARVDSALGRSSSNFQDAKTTCVYGSGLNIIAGYASDHGAPQEIFLEGNTHSIVALTDSLALYDTLSKLAPSLSQSAVKQLLEGASNVALNSLESALDALRTLLMDCTIATDTGKQTSSTDRNAFYTNLYALQNNANYIALKGSTAITVLDGQGGSTLASQAKSDFGTFLALNYLLPFAIQGSGSVLIGAHNDLYQAWQSDQSLTPDQKANGAGSYSDQWYADRSAMLSWLVKFNAIDGRPVEATQVSAPWRFTDNASGRSIELTPNGGNFTHFNQVIFGKDGAADPLTGDIFTDRLYGMGGDDTINGQGGDDYLEGDGGNDSIDGGSGNDVLVGAEDSDLIEGLAKFCRADTARNNNQWSIVA